MFEWFSFNNLKANASKCDFQFLFINLFQKMSEVPSPKEAIVRNC